MLYFTSLQISSRILKKSMLPHFSQVELNSQQHHYYQTLMSYLICPPVGRWKMEGSIFNPWEGLILGQSVNYSLFSKLIAIYIKVQVQ